MNYLKEINKHIDDVKDGEKDDFVMFSASGHIEPLYLKNCIKHFESLPENITNFIIKNYDVNKFNLIGQILQTKHPLIFQTFTQVMNGNIINVRLKTLVICKKEDVEQYRIEVSMVGVFERFGDSQIASNEEFGRVNGAAIIFPFVREHISNIAMKAGIGSLILPPVNFSKVNHKDK